MNIRSVTAFVDIAHPLDSDIVAQAAKTIRVVREALEAVGFTVQTARLATQAFPDALGENDGPEQAVDLAKDLESMGFVHEIDHIALGPVRLSDSPAYVEVIPDVFKATETIFASIEIADIEQGFRLPRIRRAAETIKRVSTITEDGFGNLRLAALANVAAWSPFFPAAYHGGGKMCIAIATESADLAVSAIGGADSLAEAKKSLIELIEVEATRIEAAVGQALSNEDVIFQGIDFSLAPYPEEMRSIGTAFEKMGIPQIGGQGSLMAAAFLTDALEQASYNKTGFCGLFLPVLEDSALAESAAENLLTINDLLAFSAVCGTGLDTIPLSGDVPVEELSAILIDVAALALRLDKPLTARLMPLPGKSEGDPVDFDFEYFADSRVMATRGVAPGRLLAGDETVHITPRKPRN